jgi:glycosyltransferase involved in cell wall biosynthesis
MGSGEPMSSQPAVLISSNFANDTGYAWPFIFRIQRVVAGALSERGLAVCLSFGQINGAITTIGSDTPFRAFEFDPMNINFASAVQLMRNIRRHRIRFAYMTDMPPWHWLYPLMRLAGVKYIVSHSHVSVAGPDPVPEERGLRRLAKQALYRTPLRADTLYAVSSFVAQRLAARACYPASRTHVIRYGIDLDRFAGGVGGTEQGPLRVYLGARATKFKGVQTLIEATRLLVNRDGIPPFVVRYAGDGPEMEEFKAQAKAGGIEGTFAFLGSVSDIRPELAAADIVVVPSIWGDASPFAAIEALAAGKPVIAAQAGGLSEIVGGPDTGVLVPAGDALALADALEALLKDKPRRLALGENARRRAHERYAEAKFNREITERVVADFGLKA